MAHEAIRGDDGNHGIPIQTLILRMKCLLLALTGLLPVLTFSQATFAPLDENYDHLIDRYEVASGMIQPALFTGAKPFRRDHIAAFVDSLESQQAFQSRADQFNLAYLRNDSWEYARPETDNTGKPVWKYFYRKKSDFFHVDEPDFDLHINPVIYFAGGNDTETNNPLYINTRGIEVRGMVDHKVGFYTYLTDNQARLPWYAQQQVVSRLFVPHEGFWKSYKDGGVDYLQARGYVTFALSKHIGFQFGHDREFIGNGYRSLIRSDFSPPSLFLKGDVQVWRVHYLFILNRMTADVYGNPSGLTANDKYPEKFSALHHASINIGKRWNVGVFETVIFSPKDSASANRFEWSYLNPIIFYRAIEQQFGSSDNVLLGTDFKWNPTRGVSFYGQLVLDEFVLDNVLDGNGWWANKFGVQGGMKYFNAFGVSNLDLQLEYNIVRPYTYSHSSKYGSYSSYRQPLAHPLGANFREVAAIVRYQPMPRVSLTGKLLMMTKGRDVAGQNWGGDILRVNSSHPMNYGNKIGQGQKNDVMFASALASWQVRHNLFLDGQLVYRSSESPATAYNYDSSIFLVALRWNVARRLYEF